MARVSVNKRVRPLSPGERLCVLQRDHYTCQYCGATAPEVALHVDHVIPRSLGGTNAMGNLVAACATCNLGKMARRVLPARELRAHLLGLEDIVDEVTPAPVWCQADSTVPPLPDAAREPRAQQRDVRWLRRNCGGTLDERDYGAVI